MSVHVEWDSPEKTAIRWTFVGRWTWGEYDDGLKVAHSLLETVDHPVDYIVDVSKMGILPPDVVKRVKANYLVQPGNLRYLLAVGFDPNLRLFWDTFTDLPYARHLKLDYFETLDDARAYSRQTT
jgi:hypothetical protein